MKTIKNQAHTQKGQEVPNWTEEQARDYFEARRWGGKPACVHCGSVNVYRMGGTSGRDGLLECRDCRKQFTVTVGTVLEDSHLPLVKWAMAFHLMCSSKKGISALQLQRNLGLGSYRTAWFLAHRIREAMRCEPVVGMLKGEVQVMRHTSVESRSVEETRERSVAVRPRRRSLPSSKQMVMLMPAGLKM